MTNTSIPVGLALTLGWSSARARYPELEKQWIALSHKFSGTFGAADGWSLQIAGHFDLMLRCIEDDLAALLAKYDTPTDDATLMAGNLKSGLSRMWTMDVYEAVRWGCSTDVGKSHQRLNELHKRLKLVRIPLAKGEIANTNRRNSPRIELVKQGDDPHMQFEVYELGKTRCRPLHLFNPGNGSDGWTVIDTEEMTSVEILRRDLSDELLALFNDPKEA